MGKEHWSRVITSPDDSFTKFHWILSRSLSNWVSPFSRGNILVFAYTVINYKLLRSNLFLKLSQSHIPTHGRVPSFLDQGIEFKLLRTPLGVGRLLSRTLLFFRLCTEIFHLLRPFTWRLKKTRDVSNILFRIPIDVDLSANDRLPWPKYPNYWNYPGHIASDRLKIGPFFWKWHCFSSSPPAGANSPTHGCQPSILISFCVWERFHGSFLPLPMTCYSGSFPFWKMTSAVEIVVFDHSSSHSPPSPRITTGVFLHPSCFNLSFVRHYGREMIRTLRPFGITHVVLL